MMRFTAVGDAIIQKRISGGFPGYEELAPFIEQGDVRFFNLETTLNKEGEACASQFSGGTYLRTDPAVLEDLKRFGFNLTSFNNNHTLDFSYQGLEKTLEALDTSGLVHAGVGRNLAEASAPRYLETNRGRVALISVNTTFAAPMMAGEQSNRVPGRPGINGVRINSHVELPEEDLQHIRRIAAATGINAYEEIVRREGYRPALAAGEAEFGPLKLKQGDTPRWVRTLNPADVARIEKAIFEAQLQADCILISIHSHEVGGDKKENPSEFLVELAHRCIDAGAHAVIGHGPHLLRPIEVYRDRPIFYSLGDFVLQLYNVDFAPEDFFAKQGLTSASTVHELLRTRSKNFTIGLMQDVRMFRAVIPYWEMEDGKLTKLTLLPIELAMDGKKGEIGLPRRGDAAVIGAYLGEMCTPYGVTVTAGPDGLLTCRW